MLLAVSEDMSFRKQTDFSKIEFYLNPDDPYAMDLSGCTLITGFYGIGKIGFIVVNHMINKLGARRIGYIITEVIPPFISVKNNSIVLPFEIYRAGDIVFIAAFFEPYKNEHRSFARAVLSWTIQEKFSKIILIGGLDSRLRQDENVFAKAVFTQSYRDLGFETNLSELDEGLYVTGPLALLLMFAEVYKFPAVAVLSYAERSRPDPIGASHAVSIINDLLKTNCGVEELIKEAENIEKEISEMMEATENPATEDSNNRDKGLFM